MPAEFQEDESKKLRRLGSVERGMFGGIGSHLLTNTLQQSSDIEERLQRVRDQSVQKPCGIPTMTSVVITTPVEDGRCKVVGCDHLFTNAADPSGRVEKCDVEWSLFLAELVSDEMRDLQRLLPNLKPVCPYPPGPFDASVDKDLEWEGKPRRAYAVSLRKAAGQTKLPDHEVFKLRTFRLSRDTTLTLGVLDALVAWSTKRVIKGWASYRGSDLEYDYTFWVVQRALVPFWVPQAIEWEASNPHLTPRFGGDLGQALQSNKTAQDAFRSWDSASYEKWFNEWTLHDIRCVASIGANEIPLQPHLPAHLCEVRNLMLLGLTDGEIAAALRAHKQMASPTQSTVQSYVDKIRVAYGVASKSGVMVEFLRRGGTTKDLLYYASHYDLLLSKLHQ